MDNDSAAQTLEQQMALALAGDKVAYSGVLHKISSHLTAYLSRKVPSKDRDDVVQEILLSIHKARPTYDSSRPLMPWAMAIARYRLHDYWRRHYSNHTSETDDIEDIEDMKNILAEDKTKNMDAHEDITRILATLPPKQRQILDLMYRQDKTVQEVADRMNMSLSAVKVTAHRSYKIFRKRLME